jgi:uncharacterized protein (TIGR02145 family)
VEAAGGISTAATKLKAKSGWDDNGNGTDNYGFSALPGGFRYSDGDFGGTGSSGSWWTATETTAPNGSADGAYGLNMGSEKEKVYIDRAFKSNAMSVRCVR